MAYARLWLQFLRFSSVDTIDDFRIGSTKGNNRREYSCGQWLFEILSVLLFLWSYYILNKTRYATDLGQLLMIYKFRLVFTTG